VGLGNSDIEKCRRPAQSNYSRSVHPRSPFPGHNGTSDEDFRGTSVGLHPANMYDRPFFHANGSRSFKLTFAKQACRDR
jgi:hypothetical protein